LRIWTARAFQLHTLGSIDAIKRARVYHPRFVPPLRFAAQFILPPRFARASVFPPFYFFARSAKKRKRGKINSAETKRGRTKRARITRAE